MPENTIGANYLQSCMGPHVGDPPAPSPSPLQCEGYGLPPDGQTPAEIAMPRPLISRTIELLHLRPKSREISLAITKLEEAQMWLDRA